MNLTATFATLVLAMSAASAALAQAPDPAATPRIDKREARQQKRIDQGTASGQLTPKESARMNRQQDRIDKAQERAAADGKVTAKERAGITHRQNKANRNIRRNKHDGQNG